jgi:Ca2+-binding EF-hand superfamily protein
MTGWMSAEAPRRSPWRWLFRLLAVAAAIWLVVPHSVWRGRARGDVSDELVKTLMSYDRNGDGKLERSEVPERMQGLFDRADINHDGFITPEEIRTLAEAQALPDHR